MPEPSIEDDSQPASSPSAPLRESEEHRLVVNDVPHTRRFVDRGALQGRSALDQSRSRSSLTRAGSNLAYSQTSSCSASPSVRTGDPASKTRSHPPTQSESRIPSYLALTRSIASRLAASSPGRSSTPMSRAASSLRNNPLSLAPAPNVSASQESLTPSNTVTIPAHRSTHGTKSLTSPVLGTMARRTVASSLHGNAAAAPPKISANPRTAHPALNSSPGGPLHPRSQTTTPIPSPLVPTSTGCLAQNGRMASDSRPSRGGDVSSTLRPSAASARSVGATRTETLGAQKPSTGALSSNSRQQPAVNRISGQQKRTQPSATSSDNTRSRVTLPDTGRSVAPLSQPRVRGSHKDSRLARDPAIPTDDSRRPTPPPTDSSFTPSKESSQVGTTDLGPSVSNPETTTLFPITGVLPYLSPGGSYPGPPDLMVDSPQHSLTDVLNGSLGLLATSTESKPASTAPVQNRPLPTSGVQFSVDQSEIHAGRDVGSGNFSLQGDGSFAVGNSNQINIHQYGAPPNDYHKTLIHDISDKLRSYIVDDATLSKETHGEPPVCYQGTRGELLEDTLSWVAAASPGKSEESNVSMRAKCIVGAPGAGKSTIMNTLIVSLLSQAASRSPGLITAHYCIKRGLASTTDGNKILPTIALQLAKQDTGVAARVSQLLRQVIHTALIPTHTLEHLFLEAIITYQHTVFVIIDALDEASPPASLAAILSRVIHSSPPNLRILLATRNEHGVLQGLGRGLIPNIVHEITTEKSLNEVGIYITHRLRAGVLEIFEDSPAWSAWPNRAQLQGLSDQADGLFIWATTAVDFILSQIRSRGRINRDRWIEEVGMIGMADVNALYMLILKNQLRDNEDGRGCDHYPLAVDDISCLLGCNDFDVAHFVGLARSILVPGTDKITGSTVPRMHKTFFDFITSERASTFRINIQHHHCKAADRCFAIILASKLKFDIASLHSSSFGRSDMDDRSSSSGDGGMAEPATRIPEVLSYASTQWWYHLDEAGADQLPFDHTQAHIQAFLQDKFLFWLEILVLLKKLELAWYWFSKLEERLAYWHSVSDIGQLDLDLVGFTTDASMLLAKFINCIRDSIPHIYISLLAFSPGDSVVSNHYRKRSAFTVIPHPPGMPPRWDSWDADPRMTDDDSVYSVSFSLCGRRLTAGYYSHSIRVWDVKTGECERGPLEGHGIDKEIDSVCFSPSGLLIASGSVDATIRVWNAETGECMLGPLTGHTSAVLSVSFSPDSTCIASGSFDGTIRVWDARTGNCVLGPLKGHSNFIRFVQYSPDGSCIASSSDDATIRLWNTQTGERICGPLEGHEDWIWSLAFHPDGGRLVTGSLDTTLRIWDIEKGICTHGPLTGHTDCVKSVCFSPDGTYIASGSSDLTIRIWDFGTAVCVAGPFGGASGKINSVAFSPDGRYLASGSSDGAIRLWDFRALLGAGMREAVWEDKVSVNMEFTDHTPMDDDGWTLGPNGEKLFWTPRPFRSAIWRPSTVRILGRPSMIKPDLGNLVTGEEWLSCFPNP